MNPSEHARPAAEAASEQPQLLRALGLWPATSIVIGVMIGSAIFIVPSEITREVGSERWALAVWAATGVLSLFGALTFAELSAMLPQAGGQYVYLREAYGPLVGFLCGWAFFLAVQSGSISTVSVGFARYLGDFFAVSPVEQKAAAAVAIAVLTAINVRGVEEGGFVQSLLTALKLGAMAALVVLGFALVRGSRGGEALLPTPSGSGFASSFGVAMVAALWAYDGWNNVTFAAGEIKSPERNLPRALVFGTASVVAVYLAVNLVYYHVLALPEISRSPRVAADAAVRIFGRGGAHVVSLAIMVAMLGSVNGMILAGARVYYAMARDGLFFRWCGRVHPRFHTPHLALALQALWAIFLVALGSYEQLFTYVIFVAWVFYALTAFAVVVLRRKKPELPRPYRVIGYPLVPAVFVVTAAWFILNTLLEKPVQAGWGSLIVVLGMPVYWIWKGADNKK
jgi:basic amino acid/polyamine antiporter, APA family